MFLLHITPLSVYRSVFLPLVSFYFTWDQKRDLVLRNKNIRVTVRCLMIKRPCFKKGVRRAKEIKGGGSKMGGGGAYLSEQWEQKVPAKRWALTSHWVDNSSSKAPTSQGARAIGVHVLRIHFWNYILINVDHA